uniref:NUMB endocytic adaptor protein n=1 Tax=Petromyzon marinus TaxID=7757 RepID=S4RML4_PETMA
MIGRMRHSLRRKKDGDGAETPRRPAQWEIDENNVRTEGCHFFVKYLGCVEVQQSRGIHVCEEAVKKLKSSGKKVRAVLFVCPEQLRLVDEDTKDLIMDQTIEKVSFCAPDPRNERAFSYICRECTTLRWLCHSFLARRDSQGERLSHAVGCAFAECLERKRQRELGCSVTATFDESRTTFSREGSFRVPSATELARQVRVFRAIAAARIIAEGAARGGSSGGAGSGGGSPGGSLPPRSNSMGGLGRSELPHAIPRRHAPLEELARQGSLRNFPKLQQSSPFKRQLSLQHQMGQCSQLNRASLFRHLLPVETAEGDALSSFSGSMASALAASSSSSQPPPISDPFLAAPMPRPPQPSVPTPPPPLNTQENKWHVTKCQPQPCGEKLFLHRVLPTRPDPARNVSPRAARNVCDAWRGAAGGGAMGWFLGEDDQQSPGPQSGRRRTPSEADRWLDEAICASRHKQQQQAA